jgi:hypothetical protein
MKRYNPGERVLGLLMFSGCGRQKLSVVALFFYLGVPLLAKHLKHTDFVSRLVADTVIGGKRR